MPIIFTVKLCAHANRRKTCLESSTVRKRSDHPATVIPRQILPTHERRCQKSISRCPLRIYDDITDARVFALTDWRPQPHALQALRPILTKILRKIKRFLLRNPFYMET